MSYARPLSHIIFSTAIETYVAIQAQPGRMPVSELVRKGSMIEWVRADSMSESINLEGSPHAEKVLSSFDAEDGLLVVFYPEGMQASDDFLGADFYVFSAAGALLLDGDGKPADTSLDSPPIVVSPGVSSFGA